MKPTNKHVDTDSLYKIVTFGKDDSYYDDRKLIKETIVKLIENPVALSSPAWYSGWLKVITENGSCKLYKNDTFYCYEVRLKKVREVEQVK